LALLVACAALAGCSHLVILHDPLTAPEHNDLGVAYESRGELDLAEREYRAAVHRDPHYALGWTNLGNVAAARQRWPQARGRYRRALREAPASPDALNNLAIALLESGRPRDAEEAERLAARAVSLGGPRDSLYRATLAEVRAARARTR
jgi:Tfp pilus assembly protein PilF